MKWRGECAGNAGYKIPSPILECEREREKNIYKYIKRTF
jgi:hypothetical protein